MHPRQPICGSDWFWKAIATSTAQHPLYGAGQADAMADRHKQGPGVVSGPHRRAQDLAVGDEGGRVPASRLRLFVAADETRLRNADRWKLRQHADMAGEAETTGMRQALTIDEEQIGVQGQAFERREKRRCLSEGQKARHIGEGERCTGQGALQQQEIRIAHRRGRAPDQALLRCVVRVETDDDPDAAEAILGTTR